MEKILEPYRPAFERLRKAYEKLFSIHEVEDLAVRLFGGAILLGFLVTYKSWEPSLSTTGMAANGSWAICWPFFQSCYDWFFIGEGRPYGYTQNVIFMGLMGIIFLASYALIAKRYTLAHFCILILFLFKVYFTLLNFNYAPNYDYYHTTFSFIFLFLPHKRFFGSLSIVLFYFLSTATKIHESWTLGAYFSAMVTDLPIFPDGTTMIWTNLVIFMEMIGAWFLFSKNKILQRLAFIFFVAFHLYSGLLVGYRYPSIVTPPLLIFFGPLFRPFERVPLDIRAIPGWTLCLFLLCLQMISHTIPGDEKLTLEGNFYGLYMFEANHQCSVRFMDENNNVVSKRNSATARHRCDPYRYWFTHKKRFCHEGNDQKISMKMTHSINGGPFYLIVDEPDICALEYKPFSRNEWIKTEEEATPTARPRKNFYR